MRVWPTLLILIATDCAISTQPDPASEAGADSSSSADSDGTIDDDDDTPEPNGHPAVFVPGSDIGPNPDACDPMHPECEQGEKCTLVRDQDSDLVGRCVPIADETVGIGDRCVVFDQPGHDDCEAGSVCWDVMNGEGTCLEFCGGSGDNPICDDGYHCNWGKSADAGLCTPLCDPLSTGDCPQTCACYWANSNFFCLPRSSNIATGEPCGFINDCAPLNICVSAEAVPDCAGSACCAAFCDLGVAGCGPGTACVAFFEDGMAPPGYEHIGVCIDPEA